MLSDKGEMQPWIIGGSSWGNGGVERYCDRLVTLLRQSEYDNVIHHRLDSAILKAASPMRAALCFTKALLCLAFRYLSARRTGHRPLLWIQYGNGLDLLAVFTLAMLSRSRVVCTVHASQTWKHMHSKIGRLLTYAILRLTRRVFVLAEFQVAELMQAGVRNVQKIPTLLPAWVNESAARRTSARGLHILFVGRVTQEKGILDLLYVAEALKERGEDFSLTVVGPVDSTLQRNIRSYLLERGIDQVRVIGECDEDGVLDHLKNNRILLYPSYVDTYPLIVLEAMAAGLHVIAYDLPGAREITSHYGLGQVVPLGDRNCLVQALVHASSIHEVFESKVKQMRERLQWKALAVQYSGLLGELAS
jgi:glycosyltransferase involved in cell wall biosynthesis